MKKIILTFLVMLVPLGLLAQQETIPALAVITSPGFFTALVAGIILALGFQLILTNLSAAVGLSALHIPAEKIEQAIKSGVREGKSEDSSQPMGKKIRKVNATFGAWAIITTSISLFFAALLAVKISTALNLIAGVTLGLAIWGLFYLITAAFEMKAVSTMVGSLMDIVRSGLRTFSDTTSSMFSKSAENRTVDTAREITDAVRDEIFGDANVKRTIQGYIDSLRPDYGRIRNELSTFLNDAELDVRSSYARGTTTAQIHMGVSAPSASDVKDKAQAAAGMVKEDVRKVREEVQSDKALAEKIADTTMELAGISRQEAEAYRKKIEEYLAGTGKTELNPDGIKRDIDKLVSANPKEGMEAILARLSDIDRSTITSILAQRKDMNRDEANRVVEMVAGTVDSLKSRYQQTKASTQAASMQQKGAEEPRLRQYLDSLDNPQLHYDSVKADLEFLLHDPKSGSMSLIDRLKSIDRHDLKQMVTQSGLNIKEEDIDRLVGKIEEAKDSVIDKTEQMRREVVARVQKAEEESIHYADEARKTAASAAWWVFGAALVSGIAAAMGGLVGLMT